MADSEFAVASPEGCVDSVEANVLLPNKKLVKVFINSEHTVSMEKQSILNENQIKFPSRYLMVLIGKHTGSRNVLSDSDTIGQHIRDLADEVHLEIVAKSVELERPPRPFKPEAFNITLK